MNEVCACVYVLCARVRACFSPVHSLLLIPTLALDTAVKALVKAVVGAAEAPLFTFFFCLVRVLFFLLLLLLLVMPLLLLPLLLPLVLWWPEHLSNNATCDLILLCLSFLPVM